MKRIGFVLVVSLVQVLTGCGSHKGSNSFFFVQMADTQFGFFSGNKEFTKETENFEKAIAAANRLQPRFVIVCGDLVNKPGDDAQIAEYKRIASGLDPSIRLYNVAGNHDVENVPTPESLASYKNDFGPDRYTFRTGDLFAIVVNSSLMKDPDSAPEEAAAQEEWLRSTLDSAQKLRNKLIIVFMHHSLFLKDSDERDDYFNFAGASRAHYLNLFREKGVKYIFAGHYHRNALGRAGDLEMVTTGPVGKPLGNDPSGFRIVEVNRKTIKHSYHSLDSIPDVVEQKR